MTTPTIKDVVIELEQKVNINIDELIEELKGLREDLINSNLNCKSCTNNSIEEREAYNKKKEQIIEQLKQHPTFKIIFLLKDYGILS